LQRVKSRLPDANRW